MINSYNIRKFNSNHLTRGGITASIFGKRAIGKTTLITKDLLPRIGGICQNRQIVISPTTEFNQNYLELVDPRLIHDSLTSDLLEQIVNNTRQFVQVGQCRQKDSSELLVMDDVLIDNRIVNDINFRMLFMNKRNLRINTIFTQQYPTALPPSLRANIDYIFIFRENNPQVRRKLYQYYAGMFPNFNMFCQVLDSCTSNYGCLVIDNTSRSDRLEDQVFWYRAEDFDPRVGAVTVIANQWRQIQAKRKLVRLRIGFELKLLPGVGIKYQEAANHFKQVQSHQNEFYD